MIDTLRDLRRGRARRAILATALLLTFLPAAATASAVPAQSAPACGTAFPTYGRDAVSGSTAVLPNRAIPMSDGTVIRADVTLPAGLPGPFPTSLTITGYGKTALGSVDLGTGGLTKYGYATVIVDDRGTGASGGTWDSWGERTIADYSEILDWIVAQPWSDGRIGLTGASYMGITSLRAAAVGHPAVKAVFAVVPMGDAYRDIVMAGGQINAAFIPLWMGLVTGLSLQPTAEPEAIVDHLIGITQFQLPTLATSITGGAPNYDGPFWRQRSPIEVVDDIHVPTFILGGNNDLFQRGEPMLYERLADHTDARLLMGPWTHASFGSGLPRDGVPASAALLLQWFDDHVLGFDTKAECIPPVTQFVTGRNRYESAASWPVPDLQADRWYLQSTGGLTRDLPIAGAPGRDYLQLPITGVCTRSTAQWLIGLLDTTLCARDNRIDEQLSLTYTTEPFTTETVINGPIQADVWVTSTRPEAVISVAVSDVAPDGTSRGLTNGLLLASHRAVDASRSRLLDGQSIQPWHPFTEAARLGVVPGQPMLLRIEVFPTSAAIAPGHQLRVTIAPFDVPHALPGLPALLDSIGGRVTVLSDADHPSSIVLPVVSAPVAASGTSASGFSAAPAVPPAVATPAAPPSPARDASVAAAPPVGSVPTATTGRWTDFLPASLMVAAGTLVVRRLRPTPAGPRD